MLLDEGEYPNVKERLSKTTRWALENDRKIDVPLDVISCARVLIGNRSFPGATSQIDIAISAIFAMGELQHLPRALLTRARLYTREGELVLAKSDLDEAWEIAERGPMRLFMADIHLYRTGLFFREVNYPWESAQKDLAEARRLIEKCGYWRRKEELEDAEEAILGKPKK